MRNVDTRPADRKTRGKTEELQKNLAKESPEPVWQELGKEEHRMRSETLREDTPLYGFDVI